MDIENTNIRKYMLNVIENEEYELDIEGQKKIAKFMLKLNHKIIEVCDHCIKLHIKNLSFDNLRQLFIVICNINNLDYKDLLT